MKQYLTMLSPDAQTVCEWNANEKGGHGSQHEPVHLSADPVTIKLTWARDAQSPSRYIGTYRLHLRELLDDGYIGLDARQGHVRVKFVNVDQVIRLARGKKTSHYLVVGEFHP